MPTRTMIAALTVALAAGCSADPATSSKADQSSPEALTRSAYRDIHAGDFEALCRLVLPSLMPRFTASGTDCQSFMANHYDASTRARMVDVKVDASRTRRNGDTAVVPQSGVTFAGQPSNDSDTKTVRSDGKWWIGG